MTLEILLMSALLSPIVTCGLYTFFGNPRAKKHRA